MSAKQPTPPVRTAAQIEEILRPTCPWEMTRFLQSQAVDDALDEARKTVSFAVESAVFNFDAEDGVVACDLAQRTENPAVDKLAKLLAMKSVFDNCPDLPAIKARLAPLFTELKAARTAEAEADRLASIAAQERRQKLEAAKAEALAAVEAKFATV